MKGVYIYGIIEKGNGKINLPVEKLYTIDYQDLAAVVEKTSVKTFDRFNKDLIIEELKKHQLIVEKLMTKYNLLSMSFGVIAEDEKSIKEMLKKAYEVFKKAFKKLKGKIEVNIKAFWDEDVILKEMGESKEVKKIRENLGNSLEERITLGKEIASLLEKKEENYCREIHNLLQGVSLNFSSRRVMANSSMIMNESFLLERKRKKEFDQKIEGLAEKYDKKINFKYIGPMFPYSFFNPKVMIINPEKLQRVRETLGFKDKEKLSLSQIKEKYRELALQYHPDRTNSPEDEKFKNIASAYELLCDYYQSNPSGEQEGEAIIVKEV